MNLVNYHPTYRAEMLPHKSSRQDSLQSFRRGDQHVGGASSMSRSLLGVGITVTDCQFDIKVIAPPLQPLKHVPVQCLEGRNIQDFDSPLSFRGSQKHVKNRKNSRLSLSSGCGRYEENIFALKNLWDSFFLSFSGRFEAFLLNQPTYRFNESLENVSGILRQSQYAPRLKR